jgi:hypothetical protein
MIIDVCVHSRHILWLGTSSAAQQVAEVPQLRHPRAVEDGTDERDDKVLLAF